MTAALLDTPGLTRELNAIAAENGRPPVRYRIIADLIRDGAIKAEHVRGRYYIPRTAVPEIAATLGLTPPAEPSERKRPRRPAA